MSFLSDGVLRVCFGFQVSPSYRGGTHRNWLKFRRDTKEQIHKTSCQFISIYFSLFLRNVGPYFTAVAFRRGYLSLAGSRHSHGDYDTQD